MVNLNREDIRTMSGGSEPMERLGAKMKNQLQSRGVKEQRTQLRSCLRYCLVMMIPLAKHPLAIWCHHPVPDFSKNLFLAFSRFEVPGFTSEWSAQGHRDVAELFKNEKREYMEKI